DLRRGLGVRFTARRAGVVLIGRMASAGWLHAFGGLSAGHLLRPEVRSERIAIGLATMGTRGGARGLDAALAPGADILQHAGVFSYLGKHGIGIGEEMLVRIGFASLFIGDVPVRCLLGVAISILASLGIGRFRILRSHARRRRAVAEILQSLLRSVAVDQLDRVEIAGDCGLRLLVGGV